MKRVLVLLPFLVFSAFSYDAYDIKEEIANQDMGQVKNIVRTLLPKIEELQDEALESIKLMTGDLINADLFPDLKNFNSYEIRKKLEEMDLDVIKGELEFLAESDILTNLVNLMAKHWDQVHETASDILGFEKDVQVVEDGKVVGRARRSSTSSSSSSPFVDLIILVVVGYFLVNLVKGHSTTTSAAAVLNSNIGMGLLVLFVARKLLNC